MTATTTQLAKIPTLLLGGYRLLFPLAALWAILSLALWIAMLSGTLTPSSAFEFQDWHSHEMLFGFVAAVVGGFVLTAVPNWTNRPPLQGLPLLTLAVLWLAGRLAVFWSQAIGIYLAGVIDFSFLLAIGVYTARQVIISGNKRNAPIAGLILLLAIANLLTHFEAAGQSIATGLGLRMGFGMVTLLLALIGGRITPNFTANWLKARGAKVSFGAVTKVDVIGLISVALFVVLWIILDRNAVVGAAALFASAMTATRLSRWRGWLTSAEPLLFILHIGYGWLALSLAFMGISMLVESVPISVGLHSLTAGAMTTMILVVMSRAILGHSGLPLKADRIIVLMIVCQQLAVIGRLITAFQGSLGFLLYLSAFLWCLAFVLFLTRFLPVVLTPKKA